MPIKISFCIPTLNRGGFIGATLESIISQATESIEIVVVDGGSNDNTSEVVLKYQKNFPRLHYFRAGVSDAAIPSCRGFDQDCSRAVELAQGEYCWLFTDDDLLKPGAVSIVLNEISKGYSLLVVNAQVMNSDFSTILENKRLQIDINAVYSADELGILFKHTASCLSFVGCVVINRDLWMQREKRRYFGTGFIHVGVIFQASLPAPVLLIAEPYITIRFGNAHWTSVSRSFDIWMFKWPRLVWSFKNISSEAKRSVTRREPWRYFKNLIIWRSRGDYNIQSYRRYFLTVRADILWKFCAWLIACFSRKIVVSSFYLYSYVKRRTLQVFFGIRTGLKQYLSYFSKPRR